MQIVPVILCGGSGSRLWPESREKIPKQFLSLMGEGSLLQDTLSRTLRTCDAAPGDVMAVTLSMLGDGVRAHLRKTHAASGSHMLNEPSARNTAAAVAYTALYAAASFGPEAVLWVLPSDHYIGNEGALARACQNAVRAAREDGRLVTFGIRPTRPETGYGYIKAATGASGDALAVERFVEKPGLETAREYLADGRYLWNSGMFVFSVSNVLDEFKTHAPDILAGVEASIAAGSPHAPDPDLYAQIPAVPFDKAIMEKSAKVSVVPCDPQWSDIGSWESLWDIQSAAHDENGNLADGDVVMHNTKNCLIRARGGKRLIACAGVENLAVIETEDAILIADRREGDSLRALVSAMKSQGRKEVRDA